MAVAEDMELPGLSKKWHVQFPGVNKTKNEVEFPQVIKK